MHLLMRLQMINPRSHWLWHLCPVPRLVWDLLETLLLIGSAAKSIAVSMAVMILLLVMRSSGGKSIVMMARVVGLGEFVLVIELLRGSSEEVVCET